MTIMRKSILLLCTAALVIAGVLAIESRCLGEAQEPAWQWDGSGGWPPVGPPPSAFRETPKPPLSKNPAASAELVRTLHFFKRARFRPPLPDEQDDHYAMEKERWAAARRKAVVAALGDFIGKHSDSQSALSARLVLALQADAPLYRDLLNEIITQYRGTWQAAVAGACLSASYIMLRKAKKAAEVFHQHASRLGRLDLEMDDEMRAVRTWVPLPGHSYAEYVEFQEVYLLACLRRRPEAIAGFRAFLRKRPNSPLAGLAKNEIWKYEHGYEFEWEGTDIS